MLEAIFTKQERAALAFVLAAGFLGLGVQACRKIWRAPDWETRASTLRVSVNRADEAELTALPGIGPALAERITEDRKLHGRFLTLKDLARVKGVTPKTLEKIKGLVRFD